MGKRIWKLIVLVSILATLFFRAPCLAQLQTWQIGDFVWNDLNMNGIQNATENGIEGVIVKLYDQNTVLLATTSTDVNGLYLFGSLPNGTYQIFVDLPAGYAFTGQYLGGDYVLDSNVNPLGWSELIPISGAQNYTIDAGLYEAQPVPEPATMLLLGSGLIGLAGYGRKKFFKK